MTKSEVVQALHISADQTCDFLNLIFEIKHICHTLLTYYIFQRLQVSYFNVAVGEAIELIQAQ